MYKLREPIINWPCSNDPTITKSHGHESFINGKRERELPTTLDPPDPIVIDDQGLFVWSDFANCYVRKKEKERKKQMWRGDGEEKRKRKEERGMKGRRFCSRARVSNNNQVEQIQKVTIPWLGKLGDLSLTMACRWDPCSRRQGVHGRGLCTPGPAQL